MTGVWKILPALAQCQRSDPFIGFWQYSGVSVSVDKWADDVNRYGNTSCKAHTAKIGTDP